MSGNLKSSSKGKTMPAKFTYVKKRLYESRELYLIFALPLLYFIVFRYGAMGWLQLAFRNFNPRLGLWDSPWVGLRHFRTFFAAPDFFRLLRNTVLLAVYNLLWFFPFPIILALMINEVRQSRLKRFVQSVTYLPHFFSVVIIAGMMVSFLVRDGLINQIIMFFGGSPVPFLSDPRWFRTIYIASEIWQGAGWASILYLAALAGVNQEFYESAVIDGASKLQQIRYISLPSIGPVISIMFLLGVGGMLNFGFQKILLIYSGPIYETADVIQTFVFRRGIIGADYGFASAVGLFQSLFSLILIVTANSIARKLGGTSLW